MIETTIARRYAQALFSIAEEKSAVEAYLAQWKEVVETVFGNEELKFAFIGRVTAAKRKKELANQLFQGKIDQTVLNFILLLLDKGREDQMENILACLQILADEKKGVRAVTLVSAVPLEQTQVSSLEQLLGKKIGKELRVTKKVEPALLGGFKVIVGDFHYDASVAGELTALKQQLVR